MGEDRQSIKQHSLTSPSRDLDLSASKIFRRLWCVLRLILRHVIAPAETERRVQTLRFADQLRGSSGFARHLAGNRMRRISRDLRPVWIGKEHVTKHSLHS